MPIRGISADAGSREFQIQIKKLRDGVAESNYPTEQFRQMTTVWAAREYVSLEEGFKSNQVSATTVTEWDIPYSEDMDPDRVDVAKERQVVYLSRTYDILSARLNPRGQGRSIILSTLAKVG